MALRASRLGHDVWSTQGLEWKSFFYASSMQDFEHDKIIEAWDDGDIGLADVEEWAYMLGHALSNRHVAGTTRNGRDVDSVVLSDIALGGGEDVLVNEMKTVVIRDLAPQYGFCSLPRACRRRVLETGATMSCVTLFHVLSPNMDNCQVLDMAMAVRTTQELPMEGLHRYMQLPQLRLQTSHVFDSFFIQTRSDGIRSASAGSYIGIEGETMVWAIHRAQAGFRHGNWTVL